MPVDNEYGRLHDRINRLKDQVLQQELTVLALTALLVSKGVTNEGEVVQARDRIKAAGIQRRR